MAASVTLDYTHTRLLVSDFTACFRFYRDTLGLTPHIGDEAGPYAEFKVGNIILALFSDELMGQALGKPYKPCQGECPQMVLCMRVDDVNAATNLMKTRGAKVLTEPTDHPAWNIRTAHIADPDGNIIELNHHLG